MKTFGAVNQFVHCRAGFLSQYLNITQQYFVLADGENDTRLILNNNNSLGIEDK